MVGDEGGVTSAVVTVEEADDVGEGLGEGAGVGDDEGTGAIADIDDNVANEDSTLVVVFPAVFVATTT